MGRSKLSNLILNCALHLDNFLIIQMREREREQLNFIQVRSNEEAADGVESKRTVAENNVRRRVEK
jgi:hypothetical protein